MPYDFDLLVIGSGPAGIAGAAEASRMKKRTCIVERERVLGGAGLNTGTIPSKTLRETALHYSGFAQRGLYGVDFSLPRENITVPQFMVRRDQVIAAELALIASDLDTQHVENVHGAARMVDAHTAEVALTGGGTRRISADKILLATGSSPRHPPGFPFEDPDVVDSDSILKLDRIPDTMTVVGGGVIGCEYASVFACLGVKVTLLEGRGEILGFLDKEIVAILQRRMQALGVEFLLGDDVEKVIDEPGHGVGVLTKTGKRFSAGILLVAAGRVGNLDGLGLAEIGVKVDERKRVLVDKGFATSVSNIYAAGDLLGFPSLASTGMEQARLAVQCAFGLCSEAALDPLLPYGLYTIPEVGTIGVTEEEARKQAFDYEVGRAPYRENARAQIVGDLEGLLKLVFARKDQKLLGVHIIGEKATELVHIGQVCMELGGTIDTFQRMVFNFPTLSVLYKRAAADGLARLAR